MSLLEICFEDEYLVAINKPHGLLVHRSAIARNATTFAVQELRNQIGLHVYPTHRLDRKTGGVLLFAKNKLANSKMQKLFADGKVHKQYLSIVRGFTPEELEIDYPLVSEKGVKQEALTSLKTIEQVEIPYPLGRHQTSRYSLVELIPSTGRMHQLRKHMAHIFHPIIGDRPHGCNKQNRFFKTTFQMNTMLLHAQSLEFAHPLTNELAEIKAPLQMEFRRMIQTIGFRAPASDSAER